MKIIILLAISAILTGCTSETEFGDCIGIGQDKKPNLEYRMSSWNLVVGIVFFELIAPPVIVATDETFCPIGKK